MDVKELRLGSLIKISPRPNEEGVLFLSEIQASSIIGTMISPRQGYQFRIKFNEMLPLEISDRWLMELGFTKAAEAEIWADKNNLLKLKYSGHGSCTFVESTVQSEIQYAHILQNEYFAKTGTELLPIRTEE